MKKAKKILKNKRGIAMESAVLFIVTIFSFCSLLTMLSVIGRNQLDIENMLLVREVEVDQIGEYFLGGKLKGMLYDGPNENHYPEPNANLTTGYYKIDGEKYYYCEEDKENENILCVYARKGGILLLYVEKDNSGKLVRWCYSEPPASIQEP